MFILIKLCLIICWIVFAKGWVLQELCGYRKIPLLKLFSELLMIKFAWQRIFFEIAQSLNLCILEQILAVPCSCVLLIQFETWTISSQFSRLGFWTSPSRKKGMHTTERMKIGHVHWNFGLNNRYFERH